MALPLSFRYAGLCRNEHTWVDGGAGMLCGWLSHQLSKNVKHAHDHQQEAKVRRERRKKEEEQKQEEGVNTRRTRE
jgi:sRNA-binding protein